MKKQTKWGITLGTIIVVGATVATVAVVLTSHKSKHKQEDKPIIKVSEHKKEVVLPIPIERVKADLEAYGFNQGRVNAILEEYVKGHFDIYKFYEQLEGESNGAN